MTVAISHQADIITNTLIVLYTSESFFLKFFTFSTPKPQYFSVESLDLSLVKARSTGGFVA